MIRNNDYFEIIKEQNKELAKFRPFTSAYEMKKEIERLNKQIEEYQKALDETISEKIDLEKENNLLKQIVGNDKKYSYGIRMGSDKE